MVPFRALSGSVPYHGSGRVRTFLFFNLDIHTVFIMITHVDERKGRKIEETKHDIAIKK